MERTPISRDVLQFQAKEHLLKTLKNTVSCLGGVYLAFLIHALVFFRYICLSTVMFLIHQEKEQILNCAEVTCWSESSYTQSWDSWQPMTHIVKGIEDVALWSEKQEG